MINNIFAQYTHTHIVLTSAFSIVVANVDHPRTPIAGTPPRLDALCAAHVIQYTKSKSVYRLAARYEIKRRR